MLPSDLIRQVAEREATRAWDWAAEHASAYVARPAVASAMRHVWRKAETSWRTPDGPVALLMTQTEHWVRGLPPRIGTYLAPTAKLTFRTPSLHELRQACEAYSLVGMAAAHMKLSFARSSMVVAYVNAAGCSDPTARAVLLQQYQPEQGRLAFLRLLDVADYLVRADEQPARDALAVASREFERSRRWLATVPSRARW